MQTVPTGGINGSGFKVGREQDGRGVISGLGFLLGREQDLRGQLPFEVFPRTGLQGAIKGMGIKL